MANECYFSRVELQQGSCRTNALGPDFIMRRARIAGTLVPGSVVVIDRGRWVLNFIELRIGYQFPMALPIGRNFSVGGVAHDTFYLVNFRLDGLSPVA